VISPEAIDAHLPRPTAQAGPWEGICETEEAGAERLELVLENTP
jgi:hypothetical protein